MKLRFLLIAVICLSFVSSSVYCQVEESRLVDGILEQTNQYRKSKGLEQLTIMDELNGIAQKHSDDMAAGRVPLGHKGFAKRNAMAASKIESMHNFAENVAYGAITAKQVVDFWKRSSGHRRNILGNFRYIGIAVATDKKGRIYYTEVFAD